MNVLEQMAQEDLILLRKACDAFLQLEQNGFDFDKEKWLDSIGINQGETFDEVYTELMACTDMDVEI